VSPTCEAVLAVDVDVMDRVELSNEWTSVAFAVMVLETTMTTANKSAITVTSRPFVKAGTSIQSSKCKLLTTSRSQPTYNVSGRIILRA